MVLLQLLVCMGVLNYSADTQVQAVQLNQLAQMGAFNHHQLNLDQLLHQDDAISGDVVDQQAVE